MRSGFELGERLSLWLAEQVGAQQTSRSARGSLHTDYTECQGSSRSGSFSNHSPGKLPCLVPGWASRHCNPPKVPSSQRTRRVAPPKRSHTPCEAIFDQEGPRRVKPSPAQGLFWGDAGDSEGLFL